MPVSVVKADYFNLQQRLRKALQLIDYKPAGDVVLIKPNAASAYGHYLLGDYTSPQLIEAFIKMFPEKEYIIAEGSAVGMNFPDAAKVLGYTALEKKYKNVRLVDLEREPRQELEWKFGAIQIPKIVLESEYVNMPKMKTHNLCAVTLGMKNQKGLLNTKTKKKFHWMDIHEAIRALAERVRPALTVMDGIIALEGNGPNSVTAIPKWMGLIVAGKDMVEVDNACLKLMKIPAGAARHIPEMEVEILGESLRNVSKRFKMPERQDGMVRAGNVYLGNNGCSGCPESFSGGIRSMFSPGEIFGLPQRMFKLAKFAAGPTYIYIGKDCELVRKKGNHVCMGNCTRQFAEENGLPHVPGCPPCPESMRKVFDEMN
jgi:uncharacterized protein (DUF362 family)